MKKIILTLVLIFIFNGCFEVISDTEIQINNVSKKEYEEIKKNVINTIVNLKSAFNCECGYKRWKSYRDLGKIMCCGNKGTLYMYMEENNVNIVYDGQHGFWIPTNEIITDEHKKMQKLFIQMAKKYKKQYTNSTVKVIFYHVDLPKTGKQLL